MIKFAAQLYSYIKNSKCIKVIFSLQNIFIAYFLPTNIKKLLVDRSCAQVGEKYQVGFDGVVLAV